MTTADRTRHRGHRRPQTGRGAADQEPLRPRPALVDVRAADRGDDLLAGGEVRQAPGDHGGQHRRLQGGLQLRRHGRDRRQPGSRSSRRRLRQASTATSNGANALALGLIAASVRSGLQLFFASYPITPASELLHHLARHDRFGVRTVQAEDEIAAANMALGAAFAGQLGVTATSGPGMDLKAETIGLAAMLELPLVVIDVQRAGPSTGLPTKTEQSDLLMAIHGRHGESPLPVIAPSTPADCFDAALEAARVAVRYRTPGDPAGGHVPEPTPPSRGGSRTRRRSRRSTRTSPSARTRATSSSPTSATSMARGPGRSRGPPGFSTGSAGSRRSTAVATSATSAENHALMTHEREQKLEKLADEIPGLEVDADEGAELLVLGWGSTYGVIAAAARRVRAEGKPGRHRPSAPSASHCRRTPARWSAPSRRSWCRS